jgi:hypothetical protein
LQCWGDKHNVAVGVYCDDYVEKLAKYSHEWTDGMLDQNLVILGGKTRARAAIGDKIKFQNGFEAWQNYMYECDLDPEQTLYLMSGCSRGISENNRITMGPKGRSASLRAPEPNVGPNL